MDEIDYFEQLVKCENVSESVNKNIVTICIYLTQQKTIVFFCCAIFFLSSCLMRMMNHICTFVSILDWTVRYVSNVKKKMVRAHKKYSYGEKEIAYIPNLEALYQNYKT